MTLKEKTCHSFSTGIYQCKWPFPPFYKASLHRWYHWSLPHLYQPPTAHRLCCKLRTLPWHQKRQIRPSNVPKLPPFLYNSLINHDHRCMQALFDYFSLGNPFYRDTLFGWAQLTLLVVFFFKLPGKPRSHIPCRWSRRIVAHWWLVFHALIRQTPHCRQNQRAHQIQSISVFVFLLYHLNIVTQTVKQLKYILSSISVFLVSARNYRLPQLSLRRS